MNGSFNTADFQQALQDYYYLINHKYTEKGSLKIVGDRYRLTGDMRTILYRGITSNEKATSRKAKLLTGMSNDYLYIDGYNVLFTLLNYRLGKTLFISFDTILRDAGSLHGKLRDDKLFTECVDLLLSFLCGLKFLFVHIYLDSPVSRSERHCELINRKFKNCTLAGKCEIVKSADFFLKEAEKGIISTSDTAIIDYTALKVIDIPFKILGQKPGILDLNSFKKAIL